MKNNLTLWCYCRNFSLVYSWCETYRFAMYLKNARVYFYFFFFILVRCNFFSGLKLLFLMRKYLFIWKNYNTKNYNIFYCIRFIHTNIIYGIIFNKRLIKLFVYKITSVILKLFFFNQWLKWKFFSIINNFHTFPFHPI